MPHNTYQDLLEGQIYSTHNCMKVHKLAIYATQMKDKYYVISQSMIRVGDRLFGWGLGGPTWPSEH